MSQRARTTGWMVLAMLSALPLAQGSEARVGGEAPFFFMHTYNPKACGIERVFLDRLVGVKTEQPKKLLLLSFFNIDCKPCRKELPFLQQLYERYQDKGLGLLVVNCDYRKDKIEQAVRYITESGFTFPVLKDRFQALQRRYGVALFPTMFLIGADAKILDIRVGYNEKKMPFPLAWVQNKLGVPAEPIHGTTGSQ